MRRALTLALIFILGLTSGAYSGVIKGKVTDKETGEPLMGANVVLDGTTYGSSCDLDGNYYIFGVPAGSYSLKISIVGYKTKKVTIALGDNDTLRYNFRLSEQVLVSKPVVVTASKFEQNIQDSPTTVTYIPGDDILKKNVTDLRDVLRTTGGVNITESQLSIRNSSGYTRGVGTRVLFMIDGVPMIPGDTGEIKWEIVPLNDIDHIEILKGSSSALYGSNAIGGVINIITKEAKKKQELKLKLSGGFYDKPLYKQWQWTDNYQKYGDMSLNYSFKYNKLTGRATISGLYSEGYRMAGDDQQENIFLSSNYQLSEENNLDFLASWGYKNWGTFTMWESAEHPYEVKPSEANNRTNSTKGITSLKLNSRHLKENYFWSAKLYNMYANWYSDLADGNMWGRSNRMGLELQFNYKPHSNHTLSIGTDNFYSDIKSQTFGKHFGWSTSFYAQDEFKLSEKLVTNVGARFDYFYVDESGSDWQISPKAGVVYHITENIAARASGGTGFRIPSMAEMFTDMFQSGLRVEPNPSLGPERSTSAEVGLNYTYGKKHSIDAAFFVNHYKDMIEPKPDSMYIFHFVNLSTARILGAELGVRSNIWRFTGNVNYVYTDAKDYTNPDSVIWLSYRPEHQLTFSLDLNYYHSNTIGIDYRYFSRYKKVEYYTEDRRVPAKILDVRANYRFRQFTLSGKVANLLQYYYWEIERNMCPPRSFTISLVYNIL